MKIHEFQAKELLKGYGIPIQDGVTIDDLPFTPERVHAALREQGVS